VTSRANISGAVAEEELNIFPGIERQQAFDSEGASDIRITEIALALGDSIILNPMVSWLRKENTRGLTHRFL
jgi:hypothetical protein